MYRLAILAFLLSLVLAPAALAAEELDILSCRSGTRSVLFADKELVVVYLEERGIEHSLNANKALDSASLFMIATARVQGKAVTVAGYTKVKQKDGDVLVVEFTGGAGKGTWSIIGGSGKWAGATGQGQWQTVNQAKPIDPGTVQVCFHETGTYSLRQ